MTKQQSFKRRIRARMATTGERYAEARRVLIEQSPQSKRPWIAPPEMSDDAVRAKTGQGWDAWCDLIDAWPGRTEGHPAIAKHLHENHGLDGWWSQCVTVGYERITGLRLPYERADGTFVAGKSATITFDAAELRRLLLSEDDRRDLFPDLTTELKSRATAKSIRIAIGPGVAAFGLGDAGDGRTKVTVQHERLPHYDNVEEWKFYWSDWLEALDNGAA